ncbi:response regulator transcription factor [Calidifontibacillus oryziterrae]|uniref:response regulator transcription factor n=1 Tax=Calidifontibacillus oryziterrae TaxID=1191699 RepID=UPI000304DA98|nr:response regulator transcription factor [Calidifontibacillus oryziterrae]
MRSILFVDDHPSVREGTKGMIEEHSDYKVTLASSGEDAVKLITSTKFDLYIFDLFMPSLSGLDLTKQVIEKDKEAIILILTGFDFEPHFNILIEAGVSGFISKAVSKDQLHTAIKCALRKEAIIPVSFLRQLRRSEIKSSDDGNSARITLNEREQEILFEASMGKTNKEIAQKLLMSQRTVEYHLTKIFNNLNVTSRAEAVSKARELKLLPSEFVK